MSSPRRRSELTAIEIRAVQLVADGLNYRDAGAELRVSEQMVKNWLRNAREVLGADSTPQAACMALRRGLIS